MQRGGKGSKPCDSPYQLALKRGGQGLMDKSCPGFPICTYVMYNISWILFPLSPLLMENLSQYKMDLADPNIFVQKNYNIMSLQILLTFQYLARYHHQLLLAAKK